MKREEFGEIDDVLTYMALARPADSATRSMRFFDGAEFRSSGKTINAASIKDIGSSFIDDVTPEILGKSIDISFVARPDDYEVIVRPLGGKDRERGVMFFDRVRTVSERSCRGMVSVFSKHMVSEERVELFNDGTVKRLCQVNHFAFLGGRWKLANKCAASSMVKRQLRRLESDRALQSEANGGKSLWSPEIAMRRVFCRRYEWSVVLSYDGWPGISFPTDPTGARETFRLRDVPNGASRRAALRHWVEEHWRKRRSDPTDEAKVRAHLRGATDFTWNGLRCRIRPSEFDFEIAARHAAEAKQRRTVVAAE